MRQLQINSHRIHDANPGPLLAQRIDLVSHDGPSEVMSVNAECERIKRENAVLDLAVGFPEF